MQSGSETFMDQFTPMLTQGAESLQGFAAHLNLYILLPIVFTVLAFLAGYYRNYQRPARELAGHLARVVEQIRAARFRHRSSQEAMQSELDGIFVMSPFKDLWLDYTTSLHIVESRDGNKRSILATVPAENFFSKESVVDLHINADFYRHLPGILTGVGIIGTFSGLVWGLHEFRPDSNDALSSLPLLLQEVTSAFVGSGLAILAAIFVTYKEKSILNRCYRAIEDLAHEVNSLYALGAGEEYLARIVSASESSAESHEKFSQNVAIQIGAAVREALTQPMAELTAVVERVTTSQEKAIGSILDEVLKTFATQLENTFGQQIERVNASFDKASQAMEQVQQSMTVLLGDIASVGPDTVDQMAGTLAAAIETASAAQDQINEQMRFFVDELRETLTRHQEHSAEAMDATMRGVLTKLQLALMQVADDRHQLVDQETRRHEALTAAVSDLVVSLNAASLRTSENIGVLQSTTTGAISGMNNGAIVMRMAADRFTMAGNTLSTALERSEALAEIVDKLQGLLATTAQLRRFG